MTKDKAMRMRDVFNANGFNVSIRDVGWGWICVNLD